MTAVHLIVETSRIRPRASEGDLPWFWCEGLKRNTVMRLQNHWIVAVLRTLAGVTGGLLLTVGVRVFSSWAPATLEAAWPFHAPFLKYWLLCSGITGLLGYARFGVIVGPFIAAISMTLAFQSAFFTFLFLLYCIWGSLFVAYFCWLLFEREYEESRRRQGED